MPETPETRRSGPPHNPGVRELVSGKREWSVPVSREEATCGFRGWSERGYLPHRDEPGLIQFITFHLADCFPVTLRSEWEAVLKVEDDRERRLQLEKYLDQGRGECYLRRPEIGKLVEDALRFHHPQRYDLRAWVIMPNHLHFLVEVGETPLSKIVKELKRYTSREANKILRRTGAFWFEDYFDTYMRDAQHELKTQRYIENNPVKALLVRGPKEWPWSSARSRDGNGNLRL
ncbi:MAG TPA: transposase [Verrucomicrobiae bacterium]|nr:transposase [Verrucomicrobiae bacterium]